MCIRIDSSFSLLASRDRIIRSDHDWMKIWIRIYIYIYTHTHTHTHISPPPHIYIYIYIYTILFLQNEVKQVGLYRNASICINTSLLEDHSRESQNREFFFTCFTLFFSWKYRVRTKDISWTPSDVLSCNTIYATQ